MNLDQRLAAFDASNVPTWVFDTDTAHIVWANAKALEFWRSPRKEELYARSFGDASSTALTRLQAVHVALREGRAVEQEWTFYPRGKPATARIYFSGVPLDDGRVGLLQQAFIKDEIDPELMRSLQVLRYTSVMVSLLDEEGRVLIENPMAIRTFGQEVPFAARFAGEGVVPAILREVAEDRIYEAEVVARTASGDRWHAVEARSTSDPVTGKKAILVHQTDATARRGVELDAEEKGRLIAELQETLSLVEAQRREILDLSAPILDVGERTLAVPIIGAVDRARCEALTERLLTAAFAQRSQRVILDLTAAEAFEAEGAEALMKLVRSVRLLGSRPIITGVRPAAAIALVEVGIDLSGVIVHRSLGEGVSAARALTG